jgi:YVTN family beta-propeller protein
MPIERPPASSTRRRKTKATRRRRWLLAFGLVALAVCAGAAAYVLTRDSPKASADNDEPPAQARSKHRVSVTHPRQRLVTATILRPDGSSTLPSATQDMVGASLGGGRELLAAGLTASDLSTDAIVLVDRGRGRVIGRLPFAVHDTAAARLGSAVYLFGGGDATGQRAEIVRVDPSSGTASVVGRLPAPSSDQAATTIDGTAYVVGGYTGSHWLDTIVAWRPGRPARVVGHLPFALRYAAVAAEGKQVVIAGGSLENTTASRAVLRFDPRTGHVARVGTLPAPTTHATAATVGSTVYVLGGRGAALDTPVSRIVAVPPRGPVRAAGLLPSPLSDLTAIVVGTRILVAGGRGPNGTVSTATWLRPVASSTTTSPTARGRVTAPATTDRSNVYAADGPGMLHGAARFARPLIYVPNSGSDTVDVIDPRTYRIVEHFAVGGLPQHVVPSWDLKTLYVTNDTGNSLTTINPRTGRPGRTIPVADPYNMYFTPDGRYAIVVAERLARLDFRDAHTFKLHHALPVPCLGVDHMDFSADGTYLLASCEFSGQLIKVDVASERVVGTLQLPAGSSPQDVKLSPDGKTFYIADKARGGLWEVEGNPLRRIGFLPTGIGAHGLYPSRDSQDLYVTNRLAGSISVVSFKTRKILTTWHIPGGGSPDMGGVSADGNVLWLSGRYNNQVYAVDTNDGHLIARIGVGTGPHGLCVWPQPGRYSLGHTGILR